MITDWLLGVITKGWADQFAVEMLDLWCADDDFAVVVVVVVVVAATNSTGFVVTKMMAMVAAVGSTTYDHNVCFVATTTTTTPLPYRTVGAKSWRRGLNLLAIQSPFDGQKRGDAAAAAAKCCYSWGGEGEVFFFWKMLRRDILELAGRPF